jgi:secreted effector protein SseB
MENTVSHNHHANLTSTTNVGETPDVNHDTGDYGNYLDDRSRLGDKAFSPFEAMAMIALNEAATDLNKICDKVNAGNARQTASNEKANDVDAAIAKIIAASGDGSTADLPQGVIDYMKEHNITVTAGSDGKPMSITDFLKSIGHPDGKGLGKGDLDSIKGALTADAAGGGDTSATDQIQAQKCMQTYTLWVNGISTVQQQWNETLSGIIRGMKS